jgi:DNA-directed RNA polymerase specialized sigma24 family protein
MDSSTAKEADFQSLHKQLRNGRRSIDDFLGDLGFERWLRVHIYGDYDFLIFEGFYGPEDLRAESDVKVRKAAPELNPEKTPNEFAFFGWAKKVVYHTYLDALRKHNKHFRHGWTRSDEPLEGVGALAPSEDFDGRYFLGRFLEFIKGYRPERRFALMLWLFEDCSYREVEEALSGEGVTISHVTIGKWVKKSLEAFKASLGMPPGAAQERPRGRAKSRGDSGNHQSVAGPEGSGDEQNSA